MRPTKIKESWRTLLICVLLSGVTLAVFWPVSHYDVIYYDDPQYVTENQHVKDSLTWPNVRWAMTAICAGNWHPLALVSHMLDVQLFGLRLGRHHLVNLLFHTANSLLLFLLLKRMTCAVGRSAFVAALFALHPLHVESVAWLAERKDVLSAFFFMLTLGAYARYVEARVKCQVPSVSSQVPSLKSQVSSPKAVTGSHQGNLPHAVAAGQGPQHKEPQVREGTRGLETSDRASRIKHHASRFTHHASRFYFLALFFFALGLMSKPMLVTLPFVLLLLDYWPLGRWGNGVHEDLPSRSFGEAGARPPGTGKRFKPRWGLVSEKVPFLVLAAASSVITFMAQRNSGAVNSLEQVPFGPRFENAFVSYLAYVKQTFWPTKLAVLYPYPLLLDDGVVIAAVVLLAGISVGALLLFRRRHYAFLGWFWYLGMLVPVIGLVQVGEQARADRYTYLPLIGIFIMVAWGVPDLVTQIFNPLYRRFSICGPPGHVGTIADSKSAIQQITNLRYATGPAPAFRSAALAVAATVVLATLAWTAHVQVRYWQTTYTLFNHATEVTKDNYGAWGGMGIALLHDGKYSEAVTNLTRALELAQSRGAGGGIKYYLGAALQLQGRGLEALPYLQEAVVGQDLLPARNLRLGLSLLEAGHVAEAEVALNQALAARPRDPEFQLAEAMLLHSQGRDLGSEKLFQEVIAANPTMAQAHRSYGDFLNLLGRPSEAEVQYALAVKLASPDVGLLRAYAAVLAKRGRADDAIRQLEQAVTQDPRDPQVDFELAELLSDLGRKPEAMGWYERALETNPKFISALNNLAWMLATDPEEKIRNGIRAAELAERACKCAEWKAAVLMGTLAAAYAEAGRFGDAVRMAERARDKARADNQEAVAKKNEELLEYYRAGKPFRESGSVR